MADLTKPILLEKWHLAANGNLTAWLPQKLHMSKLSAAAVILKEACYTGRTHGLHLYNVSSDGTPKEVDGISVEYEYCIPLTELMQRKVKWQWQGLYHGSIVIEFNLEGHIQEHSDKESDRQTMQVINAIIANLNAPNRLHNFRISEGTVLCQHCGELLADLKKIKKNGGGLPSCHF